MRDMRPQFDREQDFYVARPFLAAGRNFAPGELFDKSLVTPRMLRQLYESVRVLKQQPAAVKPDSKSKRYRAEVSA